MTTVFNRKTDTQLKYKVLVIEDDAALQKLVQRTLKRLGVHAFGVMTGTNAIKSLDNHHHDLLLLDYSLLDMTAKELIEELRNKDYSIPFVVMTGQGDEKIAVEMMKLGAQDYLVKDQYFWELLPQVIKHNLEQIKTVKELAKTEAVLASQEALYQTLIESVPHVIWMADAAGDVAFFNRAWYDLTGRSKQESLGNAWLEALHPDDAPIVRKKYKHAYGQGEPFQGETRVQAKDGSYRTVEYIVTPVRDRSEVIMNWVGINTDITERKQAANQMKKLYQELKDSQAQLIQLEKMNALGTLVAGVAHELNNPMMGLLNFIQFCTKNTTKEDRKYQVLLDAEFETRRCIEIVRNLLSFSRMERDDDNAYEERDCIEILERVLRLLRYRIEKEAVRLKKNLDGPAPKTRMKVNSMQQVFFNLLNNALDAVRESERKEIAVTVKTENNNTVNVTIADSGSGVDPEHIAKIFEPFFTTKPVGKGTGLGLSVCHGIVASHGGSIVCDSVPNNGTRFEIRLPLNNNHLPTDEDDHA